MPIAISAHFDIYIGVKVVAFVFVFMCFIILLGHHKFVILQALDVSYYINFLTKTTDFTIKSVNNIHISNFYHL